jgi:hypothetical protein
MEEVSGRIVRHFFENLVDGEADEPVPGPLVQNPSLRRTDDDRRKSPEKLGTYRRSTP